MIALGKRARAGARQEGGESNGGTDTAEAAQRSCGKTVNGADMLVGQPGQVKVPADSRADINAQGFWKQGTTAIFDIRMVNLDTDSSLHMIPEKALAKAEKEKKDLYLQA